MSTNVKKQEEVIKQRIKGYAYMHKLAAAAALLAFVVILISGLRSESSLTSIVFRTTFAIFVISIVSRIVVQILHAYEEIHSG